MGNTNWYERELTEADIEDIKLQIIKTRTILSKELAHSEEFQDKNYIENYRNVLTHLEKMIE